MKAIIYTSNTGTTAHYAELLSQEMNIPAFSAEDAKKSVEANAKVIYLGWIMAGEIKGYKSASKHYHIEAVCGVGMGRTGTQEEEVRKKNKVPDPVPVFTLQGGFDINKLHGAYRFMMNMMSKTAGKALAEKTDKTPDEEDMLDLMQHGGERVRLENLKGILDWYAREKKGERQDEIIF